MIFCKGSPAKSLNTLLGLNALQKHRNQPWLWVKMRSRMQLRELDSYLIFQRILLAIVARRRPLATRRIWFQTRRKLQFMTCWLLWMGSTTTNWSRMRIRQKQLLRKRTQVQRKPRKVRKKAAWHQVVRKKVKRRNIFLEKRRLKDPKTKKIIMGRMLLLKRKRNKVRIKEKLRINIISRVIVQPWWSWILYSP